MVWQLQSLKENKKQEPSEELRIWSFWARCQKGPGRIGKGKERAAYERVHKTVLPQNHFSRGARYQGYCDAHMLWTGSVTLRECPVTWRRVMSLVSWHVSVFPFLESGFPDIGALEKWEEGIKYDLPIASQKR